MVNGGGRILPPGAMRGPMQGVNIVGEITENLHRHLMDGWEFERNPPRIEEDLSFVPKDREEVIYVYMYRAGPNRALMNSKRFRGARVQRDGDDRIYYERAPLYLDVHYLIAVHSKFRSDAERLLGYVMLNLHEATHLVYRPRKYLLPTGEAVDSRGQDWSPEADPKDESIVFEKVALALVDDLTIGDAINFFTIHEAPYRPYLTYCARCAMEGSLISGEATTVRAPHLEQNGPKSPRRPSGRMRPGQLPTDKRSKTPFGPEGHNHRRITDDFDNPDSEDPT